MNWLTKALNFGEKIKRVLKKRPSKEEIENSDWTSCCKGPSFKKRFRRKSLWICNSCGKHHRISVVDKDLIYFLEKMHIKFLETPQPRLMIP